MELDQAVWPPYLHSLMVIDNFNIVRVTAVPAKTDTPLVVDTNAVLTLAIAFQSFETITWRRQKVLQRPRLVQIQQSTTRGTLDGAKPQHCIVMEQCLCIRRSKGLDHKSRVLRCA